MGLFQNEIKIVGKHNNKTNNVKIKCFNGYEAIGEKFDENNTLTVQQPVAANGKTIKSQCWSKLS